jgi:hypothetical protein
MDGQATRWLLSTVNGQGDGKSGAKNNGAIDGGARGTSTTVKSEELLHRPLSLFFFCLIEWSQSGFCSNASSNV